MQFRDAGQATRVAVRLVIALLVFSVAACVPRQQTATAFVVQAPVDPLLAYVASGRVGESGVVIKSSAGGNVGIVINSQYDAASGKICRTYATTISGLQSQHLACGNGTDWQMVQPLVTSSN